MSLPLKLTSLFIRTIAKPIAGAIKSQAKQHPAFKKICVGFAQRLHRADVRIRLLAVGENRAKIRPLSETKAIDNGAEMLSEGFVFSVAGVLIWYETYKARKKELNRREAVQDDIRALQDEIEYLKVKMREKGFKVDDYKLREDLHPSVLDIGGAEKSGAGESVNSAQGKKE